MKGKKEMSKKRQRKYNITYLSFSTSQKERQKERKEEKEEMRRRGFSQICTNQKTAMTTK